ncbi:hypothetical protein lerEdw1_010297 [Lerista edwardsae]|nr:hypothetical protein lerEdw1_010297 [Lerista edwardsae]
MILVLCELGNIVYCGSLEILHGTNSESTVLSELAQNGWSVTGTSTKRLLTSISLFHQLPPKRESAAILGKTPFFPVRDGILTHVGFGSLSLQNVPTLVGFALK